MIFALFSGGHDSLAATIVASRMPGFAGVVHLNTGIGIEQTRTFVRETCAGQGWPLVELRSDATYETLVLERGGFPYGPQAHASMYWHLKQRPLRRWLQSVVPVELVTGIRRAESQRRMRATISTPVRQEGRTLWRSPILDWTKADCSDLIEREGFKRNEVVDLLHRSGECLCGALARSEEILEVDVWYPEVGQRIHALERECERRGLVAATWASGEARRLHAAQQALFSKAELAPLCVSCELGE
jgi:3'-phosphoadenosine 5'-phosphosulfate sulfotransferase (PAPS reductase)/FAD synthetase